MSCAEKADCKEAENKTKDVQKQLKPCCACPDTKKARDECVLLFGEENCREYIEAHIKCMQSYGFQLTTSSEIKT